MEHKLNTSSPVSSCFSFVPAVLCIIITIDLYMKGVLLISVLYNHLSLQQNSLGMLLCKISEFLSIL